MSAVQTNPKKVAVKAENVNVFVEVCYYSGTAKCSVKTSITLRTYLILCEELWIKKSLEKTEVFCIVGSFSFLMFLLCQRLYHVRDKR